MSMQDYGQTFGFWRDGCPGPWRAYTHHAFVESLCNGTLPRTSFLHYLIQDYVFLVHFSRAWSLAVVKAKTLDEMRVCSQIVNALVNEEMALHVRTCVAEGISEEALFTAREEVENLAYTRYVLDAGMQGDFLDLIAALAPCCFGYGEIGQRLKREAAADTPYQDWIDTYSDPDYQNLLSSMGAMIDAATLRRLGPDPKASARWSKLQQRFTTATELEAGFWQMGLRGA